jgi:hypothetical protein
MISNLKIEILYQGELYEYYRMNVYFLKWRVLNLFYPLS